MVWKKTSALLAGWAYPTHAWKIDRIIYCLGNGIKFWSMWGSLKQQQQHITKKQSFYTKKAWDLIQYFIVIITERKQLFAGIPLRHDLKIPIHNFRNLWHLILKSITLKRWDALSVAFQRTHRRGMSIVNSFFILDTQGTRLLLAWATGFVFRMQRCSLTRPSCAMDEMHSTHVASLGPHTSLCLPIWLWLLLHSLESYSHLPLLAALIFPHLHVTFLLKTSNTDLSEVLHTRGLDFPQCFFISGVLATYMPKTLWTSIYLFPEINNRKCGVRWQTCDSLGKWCCAGLRTFPESIAIVNINCSFVNAWTLQSLKQHRSLCKKLP